MFRQCYPHLLLSPPSHMPPEAPRPLALCSTSAMHPPPHVPLTPYPWSPRTRISWGNNGLKNVWLREHGAAEVTQTYSVPNGEVTSAFSVSSFNFGLSKSCLDDTAILTVSWSVKQTTYYLCFDWSSTMQSYFSESVTGFSRSRFCCWSALSIRVLTVTMPCPKQEWPFGELDRCSGKKETIATPLEINVLGRHKLLSTLGNPVSNPHWGGSTWWEDLAAPWGEDQFGLSAFVCRPKLLIYHPGLVEPLTSAVTSLPSAPCVTPSSTCIHVLVNVGRAPHPLVRDIFSSSFIQTFNLKKLFFWLCVRAPVSTSLSLCVRACVCVCVCEYVWFCWVFRFLLLITIMITIDIS